MDDKRRMLRHFLAALAYRTQKALRGAPPSFSNYRAASGVRTPHQILTHLDSVLGYALTYFEGGKHFSTPLSVFEAEIERFHRKLEDLARHLEAGTSFRDITPEAMLQGPFSDAMTHVGQLAMLRRLEGSPVPPEDFILAEIRHENLGSNQPAPASPDPDWKEADEEHALLPVGRAGPAVVRGTWRSDETAGENRPALGTRGQSHRPVWGFRDPRCWGEVVSVEFDLDRLVRLKTELGSSRSRYESLDADARGDFLNDAGARLQRLSRQDFVATGKVVYSIATA